MPTILKIRVPTGEYKRESTIQSSKLRSSQKGDRSAWKKAAETRREKQRFDYAKSAVKRLAPAAIQQFAWSLILEIRTGHDVFFCLKTLALCSNQISQMTNMRRVRKSFVSFEGSRAIMVHHSSTDWNGCLALGCSPSTLAQVLMVSQIRFTNDNLQRGGSHSLVLHGIAHTYCCAATSLLLGDQPSKFCFGWLAS